MLRYIRCMSKNKRDIEADIDNKSDELVEHLIKIIIYRNRGNLDHWCNELYGFIPSVPRQKSNNKFPSSSFIYDALTEGSFKNFDRKVYAIKNTYDYEYYNISNQVIANYVKLYLQWAADELSKYGKLPGKIKCADKAKEILDEFE